MATTLYGKKGTVLSKGLGLEERGHSLLTDAGQDLCQQIPRAPRAQKSLDSSRLEVGL